MFRCFFLGLFSYFYGKYTQGIDFSWLGWKLFRSYRWETQKQILWRVFFGYASYLCAMLAVNFLPLAVASSGLMSAVFVTMILGYITADELMTWREITTIVFGLIGVIIVLNPEWFTNGPSIVSA